MQGMASRFVSAVKRLRPEPAKPDLTNGNWSYGLDLKDSKGLLLSARRVVRLVFYL